LADISFDPTAIPRPITKDDIISVVQDLQSKAQLQTGKGQVQRLRQIVKGVDAYALICMLIIGVSMVFIFGYSMVFGSLTGHVPGVEGEIPGVIRFVYGIVAFSQILLVFVIDITAIALITRIPLWRARGQFELERKAARYVRVTLSTEIATFVLASLTLAMNPMGIARGEALIPHFIDIGIGFAIPAALIVEAAFTSLRGWLLVETVQLRHHVQGELPPDLDTFVYELLALLGGQTAMYVKNIEVDKINPVELVSAFVKYANAVRFPVGAALTKEQLEQKKQMDAQGQELINAFKGLNQHTSDTKVLEGQLNQFEQMVAMMQNLQDQLLQSGGTNSGKPRVKLSIPAPSTPALENGTISEMALKNGTGERLCKDLGIQLSTTPRGKNGAWISAQSAMAFVESGSITLESVEAIVVKLMAEDKISAAKKIQICRVAKIIPVLAERAKLVQPVQDWYSYQLEVAKAKVKTDTQEDENIEGDSSKDDA
jgi:hypothetical protein